MGDTFYNTVVWLIGRFYRCRVTGVENVVSPGPAIFIANHAFSLGPIAVMTSVPVRFYPWAIAEMADIRRAPLYLYEDLVHHSWHLNGRFGRLVAYPIAWVAVNLINGLGSIPVDRNRGWSREAFQRSLALLREGKNLLIFPEYNFRTLEMDPDTGLFPFMGGFTWLCQMYKEKTGESLPVYPMAVYPPAKKIKVGKPVYLNFTGKTRQEIAASTGYLRSEVSKLYRSLATDERK